MRAARLLEGTQRVAQIFATLGNQEGTKIGCLRFYLTFLNIVSQLKQCSKISSKNTEKWPRSDFSSILITRARNSITNVTYVRAKFPYFVRSNCGKTSNTKNHMIQPYHGFGALAWRMGNSGTRLGHSLYLGATYGALEEFVKVAKVFSQSLCTITKL